MPSKERDNRFGLQCTVCKQVNYRSRKNKKVLKNRLELNKFCKNCRKNTLHKETK